MLAGLWIMWGAWKQIHAADDGLVTDGAYARVRHPQYSGLFLISVGMLVQWPTILTLLMWPLLTWAYYRLALREEREMIERFGDAYEAYRARVPAFIPHRMTRGRELRPRARAARS